MLLAGSLAAMACEAHHQVQPGRGRSLLYRHGVLKKLLFPQNALHRTRAENAERAEKQKFVWWW